MDRQEPQTRAQQVVRPTTKFDGMSEAQASFTPKRAEPAAERRDEAPGEPWWEKTKFHGESEQRAQFTKKPIESREDTKADLKSMKMHRAMVHLEPSIGGARDSEDSSVAAR